MTGTEPVSNEIFHARLTLDVTYTLNGENAIEVLKNLHTLCEHAIDNGLLTGEMDAQVDHYQVETIQAPALGDDGKASQLTAFVQDVADMKIWDFDNADGEPYAECKKPSDGWLDSHCDLMYLILHARSIQQRSTESTI